MTAARENSEIGAKRGRTIRWLSEPGIEVLWTAAIVLLYVILGYRLFPGFIRMMGKSGRTETVEWAVYLLLATEFPIVAALAGWLAARIAPSIAAVTSVMAWLIILVFAAPFIVGLGVAAFCISALAAIVIVFVALRSTGEGLSRLKRGWTISCLLLLTAVWEAAFRLASWTDAAGWITQSALTPILTLAIAVAVTVTVTTPDSSQPPISRRQFLFSWVDVAAVLVFLLLAFRTTPIVEFYHWSFWVGPMESVRQGGWLLWDVPSQYGLLSILVPSLLPTSDAWQALYLFQGALYAVTAIAIYAVISALRPGLVSRIVALGFTSSALFFRPRTFSLILPAQMTPAGGPMRFFWCYAILGVLFWKYVRREKVSDLRFAIVGTLVWVMSVAWSAESAIYTTIAWGSAYSVFLLQRFFSEDSIQKATDSRVRRLLIGFAWPLLAISAAVAIVSLSYHVFDGHGPDWMSYYEYALLFSGGYSALPVETAGSVWYLVVTFILVSAVVVRFLARDRANPALVVAVGAWGTVWAISSYFVSRSHPVNLLSLVPLLVFSVVITLHLLEPAVDRWARLIALVVVPLITVPTALTIAHEGFPDLLLREQSRMSHLTLQVPAMDSSLAQLARIAAMSPADPVLFASDGRYLMPRWPDIRNGRAQTSQLAWVPKPYEMISTLPRDRRNEYITRFQRREGVGGWLVEKKSEINAGYLDLVRLIEKSYAPGPTFENGEWLVRHYEPAGQH